MNRRLATLACAGALLLPAFAAAGTEIMPVKDIKPGMKGYGLTVFQGSTPEKFEFEVVAVLMNSQPHMDDIVVRSSHPLLSHTGICGGMSGSPMYIDGKLIGAASHFFKLFPKDLLTGVTPIERMISDGKRATNPQAAMESPGAPGSAPSKRIGSDSRFEQIPLPFSVSGFGHRTIAAMNEYFGKEMGVQIAVGGSAGSAMINAPDAPADLQPGDAFGVQLMRGDLEFDTGGTISYRDGNLVLGFGHPFANWGDIEFPMTTARVYTVMSSLQRSDKMQVALKEVGTLTIDRQSCVAGEMGRKATMIPVQIRTKNLGTGVAEEFKAEVIRHKMLTPALFGFAVINALESAENSALPTTSHVEMRISVEGRSQPIVFKETYANASGPGDFFMTFPVMMLANNPFSAVKFTKMEADIEVLHERRTADLEAAWLDLNEVKPGDKVNLTVLVRPFGKETERVIVPITIPANLPEETYDIEVGAGNQTEPDAASPKSVEDLIRLMQARYRASDLVTVMELGTIGTRQEGKALRKLPFSVFGTLFASSSAGITVAPDTLRVVTPTKFVLNGRKSLKIKVTDKGGA